MPGEAAALPAGWAEACTLVRQGLQQLVYVGKITEVNRRRRTKQENVFVEFEDEQFGTTWGHFHSPAQTIMALDVS